MPDPAPTPAVMAAIQAILDHDAPDPEVASSPDAIGFIKQRASGAFCLTSRGRRVGNPHEPLSEKELIARCSYPALYRVEDDSFARLLTFYDFERIKVWHTSCPKDTPYVEFCKHVTLPDTLKGLLYLGPAPVDIVPRAPRAIWTWADQPLRRLRRLTVSDVIASGRSKFGMEHGWVGACFDEQTGAPVRTSIYAGFEDAALKSLSDWSDKNALAWLNNDPVAEIPRLWSCRPVAQNDTRALIFEARRGKPPVTVEVLRSPDRPARFRVETRVGKLVYSSWEAMQNDWTIADALGEMGER